MIVVDSYYPIEVLYLFPGFSRISKKIRENTPHNPKDGPNTSIQNTSVVTTHSSVVSSSSSSKEEFEAMMAALAAKMSDVVGEYRNIHPCLFFDNMPVF